MSDTAPAPTPDRSAAAHAAALAVVTAACEYRRLSGDLDGPIPYHRRTRARTELFDRVDGLLDLVEADNLPDLKLAPDTAA